MGRNIAWISLGVGLILAGFRDSLFWEPPNSRFIRDPIDRARLSEFLDAQFRSRTAFADREKGILERLVRGEVTLIVACDRFFHCAREIYPRRFLNWGSTRTLKEQIAHHLVETLRSEAEDTPSLMAVVPLLERELAAKPFREWCRQPWAEEAELRVSTSMRASPAPE